MKKISIILAAMAAVAGLSSCKKDFGAEQTRIATQNGEKCELTIGISGTATKATNVSSADETKVSTLQVLVFNGDNLDAYGSVSNATSITLSCTSGSRSVYALVNASDMSSIASKKDLLAQVSELSNNSVGSFEMIGSKDVTLPQTATVNIPVNRIASRVVVKKITRNFTAQALQSLDFKVNRIFLMNVAGDINYGLTESPSTWYHKLGFNSPNSELAYDELSKTLANGASYSTTHYLYGYPNSFSDSSDKTWSERRTRLVVECTLGSDTVYYPIVLPEMESNKSYEIDEITITRRGSDDPLTLVEYSDCTFSISVADWTVVTVTDGITI